MTPAPTVPTRRLPALDLDLPVLGLGTWRTFDQPDLARLGGVLDACRETGVRLVDTAPVYARSEAHLARLLHGDDDFFVATKLWDTDPEEVEAVFRAQLSAYGRTSVDLLQVHNLNGWRANLDWLARQKEAGRVRFTGVTYQFDNAFGLGGTRADLNRVVSQGLADFVQVNLNAAEPDLAEDVLPAAAEAGVGVLVMRPFGEGGLLASPPPAGLLAELGCATWSEALLRWVLARPEVTTVLTATGSADHLRANAAAVLRGPLGPDEAAAVARYARGAERSGAVGRR
ncbi:aldo/keto reductase [Streptomyces sp. NPDC001941]|uniref:aldo/keto reductase n=1 Tax=Streptomyces sp. NPDC001941 TaxID=3154659 RepID=UPI00331D2560